MTLYELLLATLFSGFAAPAIVFSSLALLQLNAPLALQAGGCALVATVAGLALWRSVR